MIFWQKKTFEKARKLRISLYSKIFLFYTALFILMFLFKNYIYCSNKIFVKNNLITFSKKNVIIKISKQYLILIKNQQVINLYFPRTNSKYNFHIKSVDTQRCLLGGNLNNDISFGYNLSMNINVQLVIPQKTVYEIVFDR